MDNIPAGDVRWCVLYLATLFSALPTVVLPCGLVDGTRSGTTTLNRVFVEDALHPPAVVQRGAVPTPVFIIRKIFQAETSPSRVT